MKWNELKPGMIIRWDIYNSTNNPIIILIKSKFAERGDHGEGFYTEVLSGINYNVWQYSELLTSLGSTMGYTKIYKYKFERCKDKISISTIEDMPYILNRMNRHVESYEAEYKRQKEWATNLMQQAEKFYKGCNLS